MDFVSCFCAVYRTATSVIFPPNPPFSLFLDCEECLALFQNQSTSTDIPGPSFILDFPTSMGIPQRALLTLPFGLVIGRSSIPDAGIGVLNNGPVVSPGMHFGPYEGEVTAKENALTSNFSWEVSLEMFQIHHQHINHDLPDVYSFSHCCKYASIPADLQRGGHI